jgi:parallel beta-helix repeat protein
MRISHVITVFLLLTGAFAVPHAARAAESYDNCSSYIDTVPTTIATQGVWCMNKDMATNVGSGSAIEITANNVTIDCNGFKLGGLAVGTGTLANGIYANNKQNITIRNCNIRGFVMGIDLSGGAGHLVEDNLLDNNRYIGIAVAGEHNLVRRNRVSNTGGATAYPDTAFGIVASADIIDNIVDGVSTTGDTDEVHGIDSKGRGTRVAGNRIGMLKLTNGGTAYGIWIPDFAVQEAIVGNHVVAEAANTAGAAISAVAGFAAICANNTVSNFADATPFTGCVDAGGNYPDPTP